MSYGHDPDSILALAERALGYAEAAGATEAEALVTADDARLTRFANSEIHQNVAEMNAQLNLRFVVGKRVGVASSNRLDDEGLRRLAETAGAIARTSEELEDWGGLPEPTPIWTLRNRAPEQAWPTLAPWPGSPLPQFGVPSIT